MMIICMRAHGDHEQIRLLRTRMPLRRSVRELQKELAAQPTMAIRYGAQGRARWRGWRGRCCGRCRDESSSWVRAGWIEVWAEVSAQRSLIHSAGAMTMRAAVMRASLRRSLWWRRRS